MSYPRFQRSRDFKFFQRTAGNLTVNSTTWADLPTIGTTWDAVLPAQAGDVIECGLVAFVAPSGTTYTIMDVASIVAGAAVNYWGGWSGASTGWGVQAWLGVNTVGHSKGGSVMKTLVAGDLSAGTVTCRLRYRTDNAANQTLCGDAIQPLQFWVKNLGPMDPN